jgi:hypothetical protein
MIHAHSILAVSDGIIKQSIEREVDADFRLRVGQWLRLTYCTALLSSAAR